MRLRGWRVWLGLLLTLWAQASFAVEKRLALVIGNSGYQSVAKLPNTVSDARLIAGKLKAVDFNVDLREELTKSGLERAVRDFARKIEQEGPETVALIYYAGHGVQDARQVNYLLGVDSDARSQVDLPIEAVALETVLKTIEQASPKVAIAIIDACRDNPLPASGTRDLKRGLAPLEKAPHDLLIAYSTEPGQTASDGPPGRNSPFATALADALDVEGLEAVQLFQHVSQTVLDTTNPKQFPWVTQRLTKPFYFRPGSSQPQKAPAGNQTANPAPNQNALGEVEYGRVVLANTTQAYEDWVRRFPNHPRKDTVMKLLHRLNEEVLWKRAEAAGSREEMIEKLELLLQAFPSGV